MRPLPRARRQLRLLLKHAGLRSIAVRARHRGLDDRDVALASYPRSGNTWMRFLLYQLLTGAPGDFETVEASFPYVGRERTAPALLPGGGRLIKSHEDQPTLYHRAIYVVRDPRDVALSEHRYQRKFGFLDLPLDAFVDAFVAGRVHGLGTWRAHVEAWLAAVDGAPERYRTVRYEDLHQDPAGTLRQTSTFLGLDTDDDAITEAIEDNARTRMQAREDRSALATTRPELRHVGRGEAGGWRARLAPELAARIAVAAGDVLDRLDYASGCATAHVDTDRLAGR